VTRKLGFLGYDEGKQTLGLYQTNKDGGWTLDLTELPLARDLQRVGTDTALVGFDRGFFEVQLSSGRVLGVTDRWRGVTSVSRRPDGTTLVTGVDLEEPGVNVVTLDESGAVVRVARRDGTYVRLMRVTAAGTYLLCCDDHILETAPDLTAVGTLAAPGFRHAWMPHRFADGSTLVSAGYGAFLARFDARGALVQTFGGAGQVPAEVEPFFYATFHVFDDGSLVAANWQDHGPDNGRKGRQLVEFAADGSYRGAWSDPRRISSLQGILILDE
jgi:hypothetical protein